MPYRFERAERDYIDFAGGRVIYSLPGEPAFPARLASEIFLRAQALIHSAAPLRLYDPCCGGAYHLAALGFLHGSQIARILASDVSPRALELARKNLALLTPGGLAAREAEIRQMLDAFGKESHAGALSSLTRLKSRLPEDGIPSRTFLANALVPEALAGGVDHELIDLVICDVPYGLLSGWSLPDRTSNQPPLWRLLEALRGVIQPETVVAIASDKAQKPVHAGYRRLEKFQVGKRLVSFLQKT